jgi:hypothetical protein
MAMERFFPSRVIKMQYKLQNILLQFDRKKQKQIEFEFFLISLKNRQKETSRAMERFFPVTRDKNAIQASKHFFF